MFNCTIYATYPDKILSCPSAVQYYTRMNDKMASGKLGKSHTQSFILSKDCTKYSV